MHPDTALQASHDHHYLPSFYQKRWTVNGRLLAFSRPHNRLVVKECSPRATGWERDLYALQNLPLPAKSIIEDKLLKEIDQRASDALDAIEGDASANLSLPLRAAWARFVLSLHHRHPESVTRLRSEWSASYEERLHALKDDPRMTNDPQLTTIQSEQGLGMLYGRVMSSDRVISYIVNMIWHVMSVTEGLNNFLTSDRPMMRTNGITHDDSHIALPIAPDKIFVAVNHLEAFKTIQLLGPAAVVTKTNDYVCRAASRYVYSDSARQQRFIDNRLGKTVDPRRSTLC